MHDPNLTSDPNPLVDVLHTLHPLVGVVPFAGPALAGMIGIAVELAGAAQVREASLASRSELTRSRAEG